jgi:hypothetical protein
MNADVQIFWRSALPKEIRALEDLVEHIRDILSRDDPCQRQSSSDRS